jgi:dihydrolipoamide dehydrogenase
MYDLAIIGAGWAGFNAAQEAKAQGLKVALVEKSQIGGTCLNRGCIPTKALIQSAKVFEQFKKSKTFGFSCCDSSKPFVRDLSEMQLRKEKIIQGLVQAMQTQLAGIDYFNAEAEIIDQNTLKAADKSIQTKSLLIATGSQAIELGDFKFNGQNILTSDEILNLKEIPGSLLIIGGGVIGCEFASLFSILGSQVSIIELMPQLLPGEDQELARKLETGFKKRRIKVNTNTDAKTADFKNFKLVLVCVGRRPKIEGLEVLNLKTDKNKIVVDDFLKTSIPGIYAAGDCTGKIMLAHYAAYQGRIAAYNIAHPEELKKADNRVIPNCIFTFPEIASVGLNEEAAQNQGIKVKINKFDFLGSSMARILDETDGFIKVVSDAKSGQILGAAIIGPKATELIAVFSLAIQSGLKLSQIRDTIFAHPTLSESISDTFKEDHGI